MKKLRIIVRISDIIGNKINSTSCQKNRLIIDYLFNLIKEGNENIMDIFWSWITRRKLKEIKLS